MGRMGRIDWKPWIEKVLRKMYTIGGTILFPKHPNNINGQRGMNPFICDRWDLTLECIRRYCNETGCGVLLITHSISQARRLADQIVVLHEGKLIEQGDAECVLSSPREEQTRRFLEFFGV